jgi:ribonuclease HI
VKKKFFHYLVLMKNINIFTDGSCKGNPGPGGWAAILLEEKNAKPFAVLKGHEADTTNNRMEMIAVIEALRYLDEQHLQNADVTLHSDSSLVINTLLRGWKRKANIDLWEEMDELNEELTIEYQWVRGHAKNKWNNECDKIAVMESAKAKKHGTSTPRNAKESSQQQLL